MQNGIIDKISLKNKGFRINNEYLSHLIFADDSLHSQLHHFDDDIVLIANFPSKLQQMLEDIHDISKPIGLKMHLSKTKGMCNMHVHKNNAIVDGKKLRRSTDTSILSR